MFARILKSKKKYGTYEYLVISESVRSESGKSTTRNIANLGNINNFDKKQVKDLIKGLSRIFEIDDFTETDDLRISEVLEHGTILLWRKFWNELGLTSIIEDSIHKSESRIKLDAVKYIEMMVVNRCISPLSKLATSRWLETASYKIMKNYSTLNFDVEYFYRSMDYLLKVKDIVEYKIFQNLQNLFSINVKLTFYDITSTYFYSDSCSLSAKGYSRDGRPELEQIVIGVVTSYEGYPIKHYIFSGSTKDEKTIAEVVGNLKKEYNIQETVFVGDRGMITKLNIREILERDYDYIMGVRHKQEEKTKIFFSDSKLFSGNIIEYNGLKIADRIISVKDFIIKKIELIIKENEIKADKCNVDSIISGIRKLNNSVAKIKYAAFKTDIENIAGAENKKICRKLFSVIKKYEGKYDNQTRFVICRNDLRASAVRRKRQAKLKSFEKNLVKICSGKNVNEAVRQKSISRLFEGYNRQYRNFFQFNEEQNLKIKPFEIDKSVLEYEERFDGVFIITSNRYDISPVDIIKSYKNLQEVETLFEDLKHFVDIRPVRHWLENRVKAHVFICILALLLKRVFEIEYLKGKAVTKPLEEIAKSKIVCYKIPKTASPDEYKEFPKVTEITSLQKKYFELVGIRNPMDVGNYTW